MMNVIIHRMSIGRWYWTSSCRYKTLFTVIKPASICGPANIKNIEGPMLISQAQTISSFGRYNQLEAKKDDSVSTHTVKGNAGQVAKDTTYGIVVLAGISCMAFVFYILYKELLSKAGPTQVFGTALEKCRNHQELTVALGSPIEGYGETNSRGRRRHVSHLSYIDSMGRDAMRLKFYVKGSSGRTGTVHVDSVITGREISYRYIIAYLDTYPKRIIIVDDNRSEIDKGDSPISADL